METYYNNCVIEELAHLLETADMYLSSEYSCNHDERVINEICTDTYSLISRIVLDGLKKNMF